MVRGTIAGKDRRDFLKTAIATPGVSPSYWPATVFLDGYACCFRVRTLLFEPEFVRVAPAVGDLVGLSCLDGQHLAAPTTVRDAVRFVCQLELPAEIPTEVRPPHFFCECARKLRKPGHYVYEWASQGHSLWSMSRQGKCHV